MLNCIAVYGSPDFFPQKGARPSNLGEVPVSADLMYMGPENLSSSSVFLLIFTLGLFALT